MICSTVAANAPAMPLFQNTQESCEVHYTIVPSGGQCVRSETPDKKLLSFGCSAMAGCLHVVTFHVYQDRGQHHRFASTEAMVTRVLCIANSRATQTLTKVHHQTLQHCTTTTAILTSLLLLLSLLTGAAAHSCSPTGAQPGRHGTAGSSLPWDGNILLQTPKPCGQPHSCG